MLDKFQKSNLDQFVSCKTREVQAEVMKEELKEEANMEEVVGMEVGMVMETGVEAIKVEMKVDMTEAEMMEVEIKEVEMKEEAKVGIAVVLEAEVVVEKAEVVKVVGAEVEMGEILETVVEDLVDFDRIFHMNIPIDLKYYSSFLCIDRNMWFLQFCMSHTVHAHSTNFSHTKILDHYDHKMALDPHHNSNNH